ncbi:MAG: ABC transporter ATP-binding protein [Acidobacteria bacterium]|nr:ABC transporter ATP-binding protein [Acidobacteriota bacterium]MBV9475460.1 ABC transporter ATP-binding protein [Acidobacteriota bacterium]
MTPLRRLFSYFGRYRTRLALGALCTIASAGFSLLTPLIIGLAVNTLGRQFTRADLVRYALMLVGATIAEGAFLYAQRWIIIGVSRHIEYDMRNDFYGHLQKLPLRFYQEQRTGDLMSRATNDLSNVRMLIGPAVMHSLSSLLVVTGAFVMMLRIEKTMSLLALLAVPIVASMVKVFGSQIHVRSRAVQDYFGEISARVQENLAGVRVVRAFTRERAETEIFKRMNHEFVERNRSLIRLTATFYPALHALIGLMFVLVFYMGGRKIVAGTMTLGSFVAFQFYLGRMIWPLIAFGWVINLFQRGMASMKRLHEIWSVQPGIVDATTPIDDEPQGNLEIRHLTFAYDARPVLRDIDLTVRHGETIGIVGRTGSGKSTLLGLLTRAFEPPPGTIFLDSRPIETIPVRQLRDWIGMVPQETFLFSESIAENIRFGRADASDADVDEAAQQAGLSGDVAAFPQGLGTVIGERGITLSGGQKQRTAIARALVREPQILILDDSLSAVDTQTEERILNALRSIRKGRTVLIVSHRVSSVKDADHIIVLDDGRIVERGTHERLVERGGYYADLYRRQTIEAELEEIA